MVQNVDLLKLVYDVFTALYHYCSSIILISISLYRPRRSMKVD